MPSNKDEPVAFYVLMILDGELFHYGNDNELTPFLSLKEAYDFGSTLAKKHKTSRVYIDGIYSNGQLGVFANIKYCEIYRSAGKNEA